MFTAGGRRCVWNLFIIVLIFCILIIINTPQEIAPLPYKQVEGWESNITRETKIYVVPENDTTIISGRDICKGSYDMVITVFSAPENFAQRSAIRETWGTIVSSVKVAFLLGCAKNSTTQLLVEEENAQFQDLIQEDFVDTYNNLTIKSLKMLKWFLNSCPSPNFLMKTDDDMLINIEHLFALISKLDRQSILIGRLICKSKPIQDENNKWYTPNYIFSRPYFPNYLSGVGYVMSRDVASKLYKASLSTPLMHIEDVYITGICAEKVGIEPRHHVGFSYEHLGMTCYPEMIMNHHLTPQEIREVWNQTNNCTTTIVPTTPYPLPENLCD